MPLMQDTMGGRAATRILGTALLIIVCDQLDEWGFHKLSNVIQWGSTGVLGASAIRNVHMIREAREYRARTASP